jgi:acyl-homoserine-lactone acylase
MLRLPAVFWGLLGLSSFALPACAADAARWRAQVTIRRDTFGIPHITGQTEAAASFGLGYAQAEDHILEIARQYLRARGRGHEIGGSIEADFRIHQFRNPEVSAAAYAKLPPLYRMLIDSYIAGVNHYVSQHRAELPPWVPEFTGADVLALTRSGGLAGIQSAANAPDLRRLLDQPAAPPESEGDEAGSNAFALHGSRTKSGAPILVGNPHLSWSALYWEAQVTVPGVINFYGSTLPGIPVLRAGFNERLGWVNTNNSPDLVDVFWFPRDPKRRELYQLNGKWKPLVKRDVTVAGQTRTFHETEWGPVVRLADDKVYVVKSAGLDALRYYEGFYRLAKTKSLAEWRKVMELNLIPFSHFTYADADGNILYVWNARLPKRVTDGTDYTRPVPGVAKYQWKKFHSFRDYPSLLNPTGGYLMNSNDPPWYTNLQRRLDPEKYPSYFERGELRLRSQSITQLLNNAEKFDFDDIPRLKFDTRVLLAARWRADLLKALREAGDTAGAQLLEAWDGQVKAESQGAVVFLAFAQQYQAKAKKPYAVPFDAARADSTPTGLGEPALAVASFQAAMEDTKKRYGRADVPWGEANRFRFRGVDLPGDGAGGAFGVYKVQTFQRQADGRNVAGWTAADRPLAGFGDAWVLAVEFGPQVRARSVLSYGQTTNPESKHCCDQIEFFQRHQLRPVWFTAEEVKAHLEREYQP